MWLLEFNWDNLISEKKAEDCRFWIWEIEDLEFSDTLHIINKIEICMYILLKDAIMIELHGLNNASEAANCAVIIQPIVQICIRIWSSDCKISD